jgi:anti-sigma-K factor RskA
MAELEQRVERVEDGLDRMWTAISQLTKNAEVIIRLDARVEQLAEAVTNFTTMGFNRCGVEDQRISVLEREVQEQRDSLKSLNKNTNMWKGGLALLAIAAPIVIQIIALSL